MSASTQPGRVRGEAARRPGGVHGTFGTLRPVGWVMVGLPSPVHADALIAGLQEAGWPAAAVLHFESDENEAELAETVRNASAPETSVHEMLLLRRYAALAREGYRWLLVKVDDRGQAAGAAEVAHRCGATLAVRYRALGTDELL